MARRCELTGKAVQTGNNVSHANNRNRRRFLPNLCNVHLLSDVLGRSCAPARLRQRPAHGGASRRSRQVPDEGQGCRALRPRPRDQAAGREGPRRLLILTAVFGEGPPRHDAYIFPFHPARRPDGGGGGRLQRGGAIPVHALGAGRLPDLGCLHLSLRLPRDGPDQPALRPAYRAARRGGGLCRGSAAFLVAGDAAHRCRLGHGLLCGAASRRANLRPPALRRLVARAACLLRSSAERSTRRCFSRSPLPAPAWARQAMAAWCCRSGSVGPSSTISSSLPTRPPC